MTTHWDFHGNRIAVRFQYECRDNPGLLTAVGPLSMDMYLPSSRRRPREATRSLLSGPGRLRHGSVALPT